MLIGVLAGLLPAAQHFCHCQNVAGWKWLKTRSALSSCKQIPQSVIHYSTQQTGLVLEHPHSAVMYTLQSLPLWICSASFCLWQLEDVVGQEAPAHCVMAFGLRTLVVVAATWLKWMLFMTTRIADIASAAVETMQPVFPIYVQRTWILFWLIKWISGNIILLESDEENSGIILAIKSVHHWGQL